MVGPCRRAAAIGLCMICLVTCCFSYSFSAFKIDLKKLMNWDENQMSFIYMGAILGQNIVVHLGHVCDKFGAARSFLLSACCKGFGLAGMWFCVTTGVSSHWLFASFFFIDTQGMSCAIIMAMKEVQRAAPARFSSVMASMNTAFLGLGANYATWMYMRLWKPQGDVASHFSASGAMSATILLAGALGVPLLAPVYGNGKSGGNAASKNGEEDDNKTMFDFVHTGEYLAIFLGMLVTWGGGMLWTANLASFSVAAGASDEMRARVIATYQWSRTICNVLSGPASDLGTREVWWFLTVFAMFASSGLMLATGGQSVQLSAALAGGSFGATATLCPCLIKALSFKYMGTLYAAAKLAGIVSGIPWMFLAGSVANEATPKGATSCVGEECYGKAWQVIVGSAAPAVLFLLCSAFRAVRRDAASRNVVAVSKDA